jgi:RNA polymerase sigma-70 factor (ECF subfamily)
MDTPLQSSDEVLMLLAGRGDRAACAELFARHHDRVRALARRRLGRDDDTEDVAQDVFLRVWGAAPEWRPDARFETWLRRVTLNVCLDRLARKRDVICDLVPEIADPSQDPTLQTYAMQVGRQLRLALAKLPAGQRTALVLRHYRGLQRREVSILMGVSHDALESLVARARRAMRLQLRTFEREIGGARKPFPEVVSRPLDPKRLRFRRRG